MFSSGRTAIDGILPATAELGDFNSLVNGVEGVCPYRILEILEVQNAQIADLPAEAAAHEIVDGPGQNDAAGGCVLLQPGSDVHAVSEHVELGRDDVADMHGDAQRDR